MTEEKVAGPVKSYLPFADLQGLTPEQSAFQRTHPRVRQRILDSLRGGNYQRWLGLARIHHVQSQVDFMRAKEGRRSPYAHPATPQPWGNPASNPHGTTITMPRVAAGVNPGDTQYGLGSGHTAPVDGPAFHEPEDHLPDVYEHPEYYVTPKHPNTMEAYQSGMESWRALVAARGNPDADVRIYRAVPHGITEIEGHTNPSGASWVSASPTYAKRHAEAESCPACGGDMQVISGMAKARELHNEGYLEEWGYTGDPIRDESALTECPEGAYEARKAAEERFNREASEAVHLSINPESVACMSRGKNLKRTPNTNEVTCRSCRRTMQLGLRDGTVVHEYGKPGKYHRIAASPRSKPIFDAEMGGPSGKLQKLMDNMTEVDPDPHLSDHYGDAKWHKDYERLVGGRHGFQGGYEAELDEAGGVSYHRGGVWTNHLGKRIPVAHVIKPVLAKTPDKMAASDPDQEVQYFAVSSIPGDEGQLYRTLQEAVGRPASLGNRWDHPGRGYEPRAIPGIRPTAAAPDGLTVEEYQGTEGNNSHITRNEMGMVPISWLYGMFGAAGEMPGMHRNYQGQRWSDFKENVRNGVEGYNHPIFIVVKHGEEPKIYEGNHRRDAYAELGATHVPVEIRYFGHAERQGTVGDRAMRREAASPKGFSNPYHGNPEFGGNPDFSYVWFHGTKGDPRFGEGRQNRGSGDAERIALPPSERVRGVAWHQPNQMMGIHFSPLHEVAHKFAWGSKPSAIVHAVLAFDNPAHFPTERHLNYAVADWASKNFPEWHDEKLNRDRAWNYSDQEGTHRDFSQVPDGYGDKAQDVLQWHPYLPEIIKGFHQHLVDQGHRGITYGNMVEGPYISDIITGGNHRAQGRPNPTQDWPSNVPRSISAIAQPEDIQVTHVERVASHGQEPESGQVTWEQAGALDEPEEMRDKVLSFHRQNGGTYPQKLMQREAASGRAPESDRQWLLHGEGKDLGWRRTAAAREQWQAGERPWFEYHCWEDPESSDAEAWYRSHQQVEVLDHQINDAAPGSSLEERIEDGTPHTYTVRFSDGHEHTVFEDELSDSPADWYRPDPPVRKTAAVDESGIKAAGIAVIAMDTGRVLMQQRALNPLVCPCGQGVTWDESNGYQHDDGSVSHDSDEFYGQSVSDLLDQGHPIEKEASDYEFPIAEDFGMTEEELAAWQQRFPGLRATKYDPRYNLMGFDDPTLRRNPNSGPSGRSSNPSNNWLVGVKSAEPSYEPGRIDAEGNPVDEPLWDAPYSYKDSDGPVCQKCFDDDGITRTPKYHKNRQDSIREEIEFHEKSQEFDPNEERAKKINRLKSKIHDYEPSLPYPGERRLGSVLDEEPAEWLPEHEEPVFEADPSMWRRHSYDPGTYVNRAIEQHTFAHPRGDGTWTLRVVDGSGEHGFRTETWGSAQVLHDSVMERLLGDHSIEKQAMPRDDNFLNGLRYEISSNVEPSDPKTGFHKIKAVDSDGDNAGYMEWDAFDGRILDLAVARRNHRKGLATELYNRAHEHSVENGFSPPEHDWDNLSDDAIDWIQHGLGEELPEGVSKTSALEFDPNEGTWEFPGGKLNEGESAREAAIREFREEVGQDLPPGVFVGAWVSPGGIVVSANYIPGSADVDPLAGLVDDPNEMYGISGEYIVPGRGGDTMSQRIAMPRDDDLLRYLKYEYSFHQSPNYHGGPDHSWHQLEARDPDDDYFVGHISWNPDSGKIDYIDVNPHYKRRGVATELLNRARNMAMENPGLYSYPVHDQDHISEDAYKWITGGLGEEVSAENKRRYSAFSEPWEHIPNYRGDLPAGMQDWNWEEFHNNIWLDDGYDHAKMSPQEAGRLKKANEEAIKAGTHDYIFNVIWALDKDGLVRTKKIDRREWEAKRDAFWEREARRGYWDDGNVFHEYYDHAEKPCFNCGEIHNRPRTAAARKAPVYKCFIYLIQNERDIDLTKRELANPDDPDGDMSEQSAWWDIEHAKKNPALRAEVKKGTPWAELELWADKSVRANKEIKEALNKLGMGMTDHDEANKAFDYDDPNAVYLRFGDWPVDEQSQNHITGQKEFGVSVYDLDKDGHPLDSDSAMNRGMHIYDERDCGPLDEDGRCEAHSMEPDERDEDYLNNTLDVMRDRVGRAVRSNNISARERAHLVKGEFVGFGHDDEPLLRNVKRVGHWPCDAHKFIPGMSAPGLEAQVGAGGNLFLGGKADWCDHPDHDEDMRHEAVSKEPKDVQEFNPESVLKDIPREPVRQGDPAAGEPWWVYEPVKKEGASKCSYCKSPATKEIKHSEGMGLIATCDKHLAKGKEDAAACVPYGDPDPSNIDWIHDASVRVAMPLTQDVPRVNRVIRSGEPRTPDDTSTYDEGARVHDVTLPSGDWIAKSMEHRHLTDPAYQVDPDDHEYFMERAGENADIEEFASRFAHAISDPDEEPIAPEAVRGQKESDPSPTAYIRKLHDFEDLEDDWDRDDHVNTPRGKVIGLFHAVLGEGDHVDHHNMGLTGSIQDFDTKIPVSIDHTHSSLPYYATEYARKKSDPEYLPEGEKRARWHHEFGISPYAAHFLGTDAAGFGARKTRNPLAPGDADRVHAALETMRPWAQERGREDWLDAAQRRVKMLGVRAAGTESLFPYKMPHETDDQWSIQHQSSVTKVAAQWIDHREHPDCGCMVKKLNQMQGAPAQGWLVDHRSHGGRVRWKVTDSSGLAKASGKARNLYHAEKDVLDAYDSVVARLPKEGSTEQPWWAFTS